MRTTKKLLSLFLAFTAVFSLGAFGRIQAIANVEEPTPTGEATTEEATETWAPEEGEDEASEEQEEPVFPDVIEEAEIKENGYTRRVTSEEKDLYSLVFDNGDGTYTLRMFNYPVKYEAEDGSVRDISLAIKDSSDGFTSTDHPATISFSDRLANGVIMEYNGYRIEMEPVTNRGAESKAMLSENGKSVSYRVDEATAYKYELTCTGYKEDIVVSSYTGQTEYRFTLRAEGLYPEKREGAYTLVDESGKVQATLGEIIVFTADNCNNTFGEMTVEPVTDGEEYLVTIHLDDNWLRDEKTEYPIRIDPSVDYDYPGSIQDVTINSLDASNNSTEFYVGYRQTQGIARTLMKFPNLNMSLFATSSHILSATVNIRDIGCETDVLQVRCEVFDGNVWSESTATWSNVSPDSFSTHLSSHLVARELGEGFDQQHWYSYDILEAVQGWKDGTYNINKGLMFKTNPGKEDGTVIRHKTFGSYSNTSYKPSLSVTYLPAIVINCTTIYVREGSTLTIPATTNPSNLTISWSSSNLTAATINSNGVVTGRAAKATPVTITASVLVSGQAYSTSCQLYVAIADGVYYLKNQSSNYYLHVSGGSIASFADVIQSNKYSSSSEEHDRITQMWKIHYLGEGRYSIRPMHKLNMGLYVLSGNVCIQYISITDSLSSITDSAEWTIGRYSNASSGCIFQNNGSSDLTMRPNPSGTSLGASVKAQSYADTAHYRWTLESISSPPEGVLLYDIQTTYYVNNPTKYVTPGESTNLEDFSMTAAVYSGDTNSQNVTWESGDTSIATVNASTGKITGVSPGTVTITAKKMLNGVYRTASYTLVVTEIPNGTYFLKNKETKKYADIEDASMNSGTQIHQWEFTGNDTQKWIFTHLGNGYYSVKSANSSGTNYYMGVSGDSLDHNAAVVLRTGTLTNGMKWKISVTSSGAYKITPITGEANDRVLAVGFYFSNDNGIDIKQRDYVEDTNYKDEWYIEDEVYRYSIIGYHTPSKTFSIQTTGTMANGSEWGPVISSSASSWNNTAGTNISITSSTSNYTLEVDSYSSTWYGLMTPQTVNGETLSKAKIQINSRTLPDNTQPNYVIFRTSTITHEIGHFLGLEDNPPVTPNSSLMHHNRNRYTIYAPQSFDIENVTQEYNCP